MVLLMQPGVIVTAVSPVCIYGQHIQGYTARLGNCLYLVPLIASLGSVDRVICLSDCLPLGPFMIFSHCGSALVLPSQGDIARLALQCTLSYISISPWPTCIDSAVPCPWLHTLSGDSRSGRTCAQIDIQLLQLFTSFNPNWHTTLTSLPRLPTTSTAYPEYPRSSLNTPDTSHRSAAGSQTWLRR